MIEFLSVIRFNINKKNFNLHNRLCPRLANESISKRVAA